MLSTKQTLAEKKAKLNWNNVDGIIRHSLIEDIGKGDITTQLTIPESKTTRARIVVKEDCVACGVDIAKRVFELVDKSIVFSAKAKDGQKIKNGKTIAEISGNARHILHGERVALNFLGMLCGIATTTREYVDSVEPLKVKITDTRKTMPGLRELQKYAVRIGDGYNHRISLDEMILIKDSHIEIAQGIDKLPSVPKGFKIEIEVENIAQFNHALQFKPDIIMLDNMDTASMKEAVKIRDGIDFSKSHHPRTLLEASGGITLKNVRQVAETGVDIISIGELTHSVKSVDVSLEISA
ncbi:MAG: carboxylating nicotinate-nucleotide diphosphorylase [Candidatus Omnitrophica bacterium]|nr:carboxylating nicotinate-nucleotide diphosphorylase [Candidatus Omnitrophota bacterium]